MKNLIRKLTLGIVAAALSSGMTGHAATMAIYSHGTTDANVVEPGGTTYDLPWDTTVREDFGYTLGGNNVNVTAEAGHHLVLHNARYDAVGADGRRREIQQYIVTDGSPAPIGWGQGYIRSTGGQYEAVVSGGGIIELPASGTLAIQNYRTDNQTDDDISRIADASGFQLLKLDDMWDYCRLSRSTDQSGPTSGTYIPVQYDVQDELDTGSFGHTAGNAEITLKTPGHYLVFANTYLYCTVERTLLLQRLTLDDALVPGSVTMVYIRGNQDTCDQGAAFLGTIIETTSADQVLKVEGALGVDRSPSTIKADKTAVTIVKLPDTGDYVRLDDGSTSNDLNPTTPAVLGWDTVYELDATGFSHSGSQITAAMDDDYLFLTAVYDPTATADRQYFWQRWTTAGTGSPLPYGGTGGYGRRSGADEVGNSSGVMLGMTSGTSIEAMSQSLAATGVMEAEEQGLQGVRLGSIFSTSPISMFNLTPASIGITSTRFNGRLMAGATNATVYVHWGLTDGTNNPAAWDDSAMVGAWTNVALTNVSYLVETLSQGTAYYYNYRATDGVTDYWAEPSMFFSTLDTPAVTNAGGATEVFGTTATLNGELTAGTAADAYICWGSGDGGTSGTSGWDNVVAVGAVLEAEPFSAGITDLTPLTGYSYRCYVTNEAGEAWSTLASFSTIEAINTMVDDTGGDDSWNTGANWMLGRAPVGDEEAIVSENLLAHAQNAATPAYSGALTLGTNSQLKIFNNAADINALGTNAVTMHEGSWLRFRSTQTRTVSNPFALLGNVTIRTGESTAGSADVTFNGPFSGAYAVTLQGNDNSDLVLNASNEFTSVTVEQWSGNGWDQNLVVYGGAAGALGTGPVTVQANISLVIDANEAMGAGATLNLWDAKSGNVAGKLVMNATNTIDHAFIDSYPLQAGDYGRIGTPSTVDYEMSWISGDGVLTVSTTPADSTAPTVVSIDSPPAADPLYGTPPITFTVTFDEDIDETTVAAADFGNAGTAPYSIGTVTKTSEYPYPAVFTVEFIPSGVGTVQFQVAGEVKDRAGNALSVPADDDTIYTLAAAGTSPRGEITFDGVATAQNGGGDITLTFDVSGSDKLVVVVTGEHGFPANLGGDCHSVTYDGVLLTQAINRSPIGSAPSADFDQTYNDVWYLDDPGLVHTGGVIFADVTSRGSLTAFAISGTAPGVGATVISPQESKSAELYTATPNSIVIASHGMGGNGNTANVDSVDTVPPLIETSAQENGSLWDGHVTGYMMVDSPSLAVPTFVGGYTVGSHTIAAEFQAVELPPPGGTIVLVK